MTNYIEKMMRTAGVEQYPQEILLPNEYEYPDFTAEKQLQIIKLLNDTSDLHCVHNTLSSLTEEEAIEVYNEDFTQALAQLTTELMNAGKLDKKKVKGILEDAR